MQTNQICSICQRQPQDLLVLICGHNLCVSCATQIYTLNGSVNPFICQICLVQTQLDVDTIAHFQSATQRIVANDVVQYIKDKGSTKKQKSNNKPPKSKSPQKKHNGQKNYCKIHNQPALYYCYNCNTVQICSQCILTPKHNTHKVLTLKKALLSLQNHLQQQKKSLQTVKSQLSQQKQYLILKKAQCIKSYLHKKQRLKQLFDQILQSVSDKYAELCIKIQQQSNKSNVIYQAYIAQLQQKTKIIQDTIKMQIRASKQQSQKLLTQYNGIPQSKIFSTLSLPKQLPYCKLQIPNSQSLTYQLNQILSQYIFNISHNDISYQSQIDYSIINQQQIHDQQPQKTILKQSYKRSINGNNSNHMHQSQYLQNRFGSSRKLELSRSIENAAFIINKLQQRSKVN